jgi:MtN3 and saliva related transmembrane protein
VEQVLTPAIGTLAALCSIASFAPQLFKLVRERKADAISWRMYALTVSGFSAWVVYGVLIRSWPVIASNTACLALSATILALTLRVKARTS